MRRFLANFTLIALLLVVVSGCAATPVAPTAVPTSDHSSMSGMDHATMPADTTQPYDALFIDSMIIHHEGAITMAKQALNETETPAIRELATAIIAAQEAEIAQMKAWRTAWFPDLPATSGLSIDMGPMSVADDASKPFDQRFAEAMIPHHEGAIMMAKDALQKSQRQEIKALSQAIITTQEAEVTLMRTWLP